MHVLFQPWVGGRWRQNFKSHWPAHLAFQVKLWTKKSWKKPEEHQRLSSDLYMYMVEITESQGSLVLLDNLI